MQLTEKRRATLVTLVLGLILVAQSITHLAWLPISAHSGQAGIPWMMNQGHTLFGNLLEQHAPASSVVSALAMRFFDAEPILVTRFLNLLVVLALTWMIFLLATRLAGKTAGLFAALMWFFWEPVYGNILFYFDTLVGFMVMGGLVLWVTLAQRQPTWLAALAAGLALGGATLAKQHAWAAVALFGVWLLINRRNLFPSFAIGAVMFPLAAVALVALQGNFEAYLYWNWLFNLSGLMDSSLPSGNLIRKLLLSNIFVPVYFLMLARGKDQRLWLPLGLIWLATILDLLPRFSDSQAMAHLPLACVIGGITVAVLRPRFDLHSWRQQTPFIRWGTAGIALVVMGGWLWTCAAPYFSAPLGRTGIPAYDEFTPVAQALTANSQPGDTLFVLPETDSTPQLHLMSGFMPPGTWIKGWRWYLEAPGTLDNLLGEWRVQPPTFIVVFPDLLVVGQPAIQPLLDFTEAQYRLVETVPDVVFHGDALIYRYED